VEGRDSGRIESRKNLPKPWKPVQLEEEASRTPPERTTTGVREVEPTRMPLLQVSLLVERHSSAGCGMLGRNGRWDQDVQGFRVQSWCPREPRQ